ncbi:MAG TPA: deoxyribose-phosphate aldolase [Bacteroidales bacterium]|jgi:deoxyribose-phosphate aldolase|nr:deoxyribose-phosphate aldolase [Bacteroidales bacterium]HKM12244.1 deoxyribose-phosphate aldolase [Bacteroidales bacterium]HPB89126.1 deoxyribose-phosphate aldolase [Bacteroidales bacterium]HPY22158.1 deoxyribose-phosphate aldolase [Bacteroidales bacterium]HQA93178.1 deoxyribose-phosphate aldolase [Bacteroidales bacterium]
MKEIYKNILGLIDLTSLNATDTRTSVKAIVEKVNNFNNVFPDYPMPASICVYPNFAGVIAGARRSRDIRITVVGGCFPASQSPLKVKVLECTEAVTDGADEVDIVLALNSFLDGRPEEASREIYEINKAVKAINSDVHLKVILETGALKDATQIEQASMLAMEAGADFIKTSTGKISPAATPEAAQVMCQAIAKYYDKTGRKVGFKPAGGISTPEEALVYYNIVSDTLGSKWLTPALFRFGASRMANNILSALEGKEVKYF